MEWQVVAIWAIVICALASVLPLSSRQKAPASTPPNSAGADEAAARRRRLRAIGY